MTETRLSPLLRHGSEHHSRSRPHLSSDAGVPDPPENAVTGTTANLDTQLILHTRWQFGPCSVGSTFNLLERYLRNTGLASSLDVSDQAIETDSIAAPPQACEVTRPGEALGDVAAGIGTDDEIYVLAYALSLES